MLLRAAAFALLLGACDRTPAEPSAPSEPVPTAKTQASSPSASAPKRPATPWTQTLPAELRPAHQRLASAVRKGLPKGSADYADALALVMLHGRGDLDFEALNTAVAARALPPHPLGDGYLLMTPPRPPPGHRFDPAIMPPDWADTWGEIAMAYLLGELSKAQYEALHQAAHPKCK